MGDMWAWISDFAVQLAETDVSFTVDGAFVTAIGTVIVLVLGLIVRKNTKEHEGTTAKVDAAKTTVEGTATEVTAGFENLNTKLDALTASVAALEHGHEVIVSKVGKIAKDQDTLLTWMVSQDERMDVAEIPQLATKAANNGRARRKVSTETAGV